jgi:hypothetical protein
VAEFILARENGRKIPREDRIFGISSRAKTAIAEKGRDNVISLAGFRKECGFRYLKTQPAAVHSVLFN